MRHPDHKLLMRIAAALGQDEFKYEVAHIADYVGRELNVRFGSNEAESIRRAIEMMAKESRGTE